MTKQVGLLGRSIGYSLSPKLHKTAIMAAGLDWEYMLLDTEPEYLPMHMDKLRHPDWAGANVTIPYKQIISGLVDEVDSKAKGVGAINTIVNRGGKLVGYNTDVPGLARDLARLNIEIPGKEIVILGAGGAAAAVLANIHEARVSVICRRQEQGRNLAQGLDIPVQVLPWNSARPPCDLLFNCTPPASGWQKFATGTSTIYDFNYHENSPPAGDYHNGLGLLVFQAAESFRLWTGFDPVEAMAAVVGMRI